MVQNMTKLQFAAPCLFGVEGILAEELRRLGAEEVTAENGRVLSPAKRRWWRAPTSVPAMPSGFFSCLGGLRRAPLPSCSTG